MTIAINQANRCLWCEKARQSPAPKDLLPDSGDTPWRTRKPDTIDQDTGAWTTEQAMIQLQSQANELTILSSSSITPLTHPVLLSLSSTLLMPTGQNLSNGLPGPKIS